MIAGKQHIHELFVCGEENENDKPDYAALFQAPEAQEYLNSYLSTKVAEAVDRETASLKESKGKILDEKKKLEAQLKGLATTAEDQADLDALKAGKLQLQDLVDKRVNAANQDWQTRLQGVEGEKSELQKALEGERSKLKQYQLKNLIGQEALKNEFFQPSAIDDLLMVAANDWSLTDNDELVSRDKNGNIRIGKDGKPLTPGEWIQGLTQTKPHYFKVQAGSGSKGNANQGGQRTMSLKEWQTLFSTANAEEQKKLLAAKASGELRIAQ
ncbi:hypothetical protein [Pseudomonas koreensis]|uniref:hypothetical protein n=1 Tax=Pseudomonas koreensis TaxID=198620 RepID=UPI0020774315|nr:hypothetical protein [Pseudomonas koreensis]MCM8742314.1 hypothetical protein [Pseudomonas koreensis]